MKNEKLIGFLEKQNGFAVDAERTGESMAEKDGDSEELRHDSCTSTESPLGLMDYVKAKVSKAMSNIVEFMQDVVASPAKPASGADRSSADEGPDSGSLRFVFGTGFMALAVAAIVVILLKRRA